MPHFSGPGQTPHRYSEMSPFHARIALHQILLFHWRLISKQYSDGHQVAGYLCVTAGDSPLLPVEESPSMSPQALLRVVGLGRTMELQPSSERQGNKRTISL